MDGDTHLLPLMYAYSVQMLRSINISPFTIALTQPPPTQVTVSRRGTNLATDDNRASPMFAPVSSSDELRFSAKKPKNLTLAQRGYKKDNNGQVRFVPISQLGDYIILDRLPLKCTISYYHARRDRMKQWV